MHDSVHVCDTQMTFVRQFSFCFSCASEHRRRTKHGEYKLVEFTENNKTRRITYSKDLKSLGAQYGRTAQQMLTMKPHVENEE